MRRTSSIVLAAVLLVTAPAALAGGTDYGAGLSGRDTIKVQKLLADADRFVGETVRVKGVVTGVCEKMGCWMTLVTGEGPEALRVKVTDGVIVFPLSAKGKKAIAEGTLRRIEMSLEQTVAHERHLAEERGEPFDAASVREPRSFYQLEAVGARIF